jgi:hypothetical protein
LLQLSIAWTSSTVSNGVPVADIGTRAAGVTWPIEKLRGEGQHTSMVPASDVAETILSGGSASTRLVGGRKKEQLLLPPGSGTAAADNRRMARDIGATAEPTS